MKTLSGKQLTRILERKGRVRKRVSGSHHIYEHQNFDSILSVPVHGNKDLKVGLQRYFMMHAGIDESEL